MKQNTNYLVCIEREKNTYTGKSTLFEVEIIRTVVPNESELVKFLMLIKQTNGFQLVGISIVNDYKDYDDVIKRIQDIVKPNNLSFGKGGENHD